MQYELLLCAVDDGAPLELSSSPTQLRVGGSYRYGTVLENVLVLWCGVALLAAGAVGVAIFPSRGKSTSPLAAMACVMSEKRWKCEEQRNKSKSVLTTTKAPPIFIVLPLLPDIRSIRLLGGLHRLPIAQQSSLILDCGNLHPAYPASMAASSL
jgi:hypothetical protein